MNICLMCGFGVAHFNHIDGQAPNYHSFTGGNPALGGMAGRGAGERLQFALPSLPTSINRLYLINHNQRRVSLSDEALLWKTRVTPCILPCEWEWEAYKLTLVYQSPRWVLGDGRLRRMDLCNLDKLCIDTLCAKWGWDDSLLTEVIRRKEWYEWDRILVTLERGVGLR